MDYSFNLYNSLAPEGVCLALKKTVPLSLDAPVVLCIGSDLSVGDSLGPVTGTKLKEALSGLNCFVYGTLEKPITAHEVKYMNEFLKLTHPNSPIIAVDAAVGLAGDIGLIKIARKSLKPGSGANKKLQKIGDVSIMGIIAEQSVFNYTLFSSTRLNVIYKMSQIIADGITSFFYDRIKNSDIEEVYRKVFKSALSS